MDRIEWDQSLSVGVGLIDEQHRMLISRLDDLSKALEQHQEGALVLKTLDFLSKYTHFHFSEEENKMKESGYPHFEEHHRLHQEFIDKLKEMERDFDEDGITRALGESVNTFLWNWLVNHIREVDTRFGKYLNSKK
ncbi:MAG: bacteriohemerythrin [Thermoplasmatota archaeon]